MQVVDAEIGFWGGSHGSRQDKEAGALPIILLKRKISFCFFENILLIFIYAQAADGIFGEEPMLTHAACSVTALPTQEMPIFAIGQGLSHHHGAARSGVPASKRKRLELIPSPKQQPSSRVASQMTLFHSPAPFRAGLPLCVCPPITPDSD